MNKNLNSLVTLFVIAIVAFGLLNVFSSSTPTTDSKIFSNSYIDATGEEVSLYDYSGDYVWVDYAAEWCSYCKPQAKTVRSLERKYGDRLVFLTVVTGTNKVMEPPTAQTAMNWARRFNLDPEKVFAYFSTNTLPYHILYSPSGEVLHENSGLYSAGQITNILNAKTPLLD